jgi:hypothetical protein
MKTMLIFFVVALAAASILAMVFYRLGLVMANLEEQLVGIWVNAAGTMRVLIYRADGSLQGDIVWVKGPDDKILGAGLLRGITARGRKGGLGTFIDPVTHLQQPVQLKLANRKLLRLQLPAEGSGQSSGRVETWSRVDP